MVAPTTPPQRPRKPAPDPYEGLPDEDVLELAKTALNRAEKLGRTTMGRKVQLAIFDDAMGELARRAMRHVLWKIHERERGTAEAEEVVALAQRSGDDHQKMN